MNYSIPDIVKNDLCTGCGVCISESVSSKMIWDDNGFMVPDVTHPFSETAIKLCPFNPSPDKAVQDEDQLADIFLKNSGKYDDRIGRYENTYVGYANEHRNNSSSGGLATFVFEQLLKQHIVDHLFIVKEINGSYQYQWFEDAAHISQISKTRYIPVTLENLFKEIDSKPGKVAVSGVACFVKAIRLKQYYNPQYKDKIPFIVGIICGGLKSRFFTDYLAQKSGIDGDYSQQEYRIKDPNSTASDYSFGAFDRDKEFHQMKMKQVGDMWGSGLFKSNACDFCDDVTTELADISLGDAWLNPYNQDGKGTSVIVTRTKSADQLVLQGIANKELSVEELSEERFKMSQQGSFKHRQLGMQYRMKKLSKHKITLIKRSRYLQWIPFEYAIVQKQRMKLRAKSIAIWKAMKNVSIFEQSILSDKINLLNKTKWYHRLQKIKQLLKLRTM